ncbi:MAG: NnrU family protein [Betaproteobacteria bacterium]
MTLLVVGLLVFLGVHLVPVATPLRARLLAAAGERRYKGLFSLVSFVGLALIVVGYYAGERGPQLFAPVPAARAVAPAAMALAFILFAAANMRGYLRRVLKHPMLIGLLIWSSVHLLANGDLRGTILFGAFLAFALVDLASASARGAVKRFEPTARHDVIAVVAGLLLAVVVMALHRWLFGVRVVSFGF